jgi:hypothetical protein
VRIRIAASGINPGDIKKRCGSNTLPAGCAVGATDCRCWSRRGTRKPQRVADDLDQLLRAVGLQIAA